MEADGMYGDEKGGFEDVIALSSAYNLVCCFV